MVGHLPGFTVYTHGVCVPNPGAGGWGAVLLGPDGQARELCGGEADTTNNRMGVRAAVEGLRALPCPCHAVFYTASEYLCRGLERLRSGKPLPETNPDLWREVAAEAARHVLECRAPEGPAGRKWNKRADTL